MNILLMGRSVLETKILTSVILKMVSTPNNLGFVSVLVLVMDGEAKS